MFDILAHSSISSSFKAIYLPRVFWIKQALKRNNLALSTIKQKHVFLMPKYSVNKPPVEVEAAILATTKSVNIDALTSNVHQHQGTSASATIGSYIELLLYGIYPRLECQ
jgi:hypothetical protein